MFLTTYFVFLSGSTDGRIHIWNAENGQKVCVLNGDHKSAVQCVLVIIHTALPMRYIYHSFPSKFNPKYMMMASACSSMSFWLPNIDDEVLHS